MRIKHKILALVLGSIVFSVGASLGAVYLWHQRASLVSLGFFVTVVVAVIGYFAASKFSLHLTEPLELLSKASLAVSAGNFNSSLSVDRSDEIGTLAQSYSTMRKTLDLVIEEMAELMLAVQEGKLDSRGKGKAFSGDWKELIESVNTVIEAFNAPFSVTVSSLERIAKGDIPDRVVENYKGDFEHIVANLNLLIDSMNEVTWLAVMIAGGNLDVDAKERSEDDRLMKALNMMILQLNTILQETNALNESVQNGDLTARGNTEELTGGWSKLVTGINNVVDAFVGPILTSATSLDRISRGDIPPKITQEYKGDFNEMKNNLNSMIDTAKGLLREINGTTQAIQDGKLSARIHTENLSGDWEELGQGINNVIEAFVTPIDLAANAIARIAKGDIPDSIDAEYKGDFNEIIHNLNLLIDNVRDILQELGGIIHAVEEGKLAIRGQAEVFVGDWKELILGINNVIEAFVSPINMAATTIERIGRGDIPELISDKTEFKGDFNRFKQSLNLLITATNDVTRVAMEMAKGNLELEVNERSEHDSLMQAMNTMIQRTREVAANARLAADSVAIGSSELSSSAEEVSEGVSQQASAMEEVSSSMEQMTANIRQNAQNAKQTESIARQAAEYAEQGEQVVAEAVTAMQQISEKILIIEEIAMQTRLLSLNATIEAARAQEHGKAFSVVASEVRKLADTTKTAAEEISRLATSSLEVSRKAGEMLGTLVPSIHKTSELVQEISAATNEQSLGTDQINYAVHQLDQVTQQNALTSDQMASTSETLAVQAKQLQESVRFFHFEEIAKTRNARNGQAAALTSQEHSIAEQEYDRENPRLSLRAAFDAEERRKAEAGVEDETDEHDDEFERF